MNNYNIVGEEWKEINGYDGLYLVSDHGRFKSFHQKEYKHKPADFFIWGHINEKGYKVISLTKDNKAKEYRAHRLIAEAFVPNPKIKPEVNHIDGNKINNRVDNLEWVTGKENIRHAYEAGLSNNFGSKHHFAKLTEEDVIKIRNMYLNGVSSPKIASIYDMNKRTIMRLINRKTWKHVP